MKRWTGIPWQRFGLSARVGWLVVAGYGFAGVLIVIADVRNLEGAYATRPVDEIALAASLLFGSACGLRAARFADGRRRLGWLAMVTAQLGWAIGELIWAFYDVRSQLDHASHPAAAEIVLLLWPFGALTSLVALSNVSRHSSRRLVLDGLILVTSLLVVSWVFVLEKQLRDTTGSRTATVAQVVNDGILLTTAILMLSRGRPGERPSRSLAAAGIAVISIADITMVFDTGIGSYHVSDLGDLGRVAGLCMITLGALASVDETTQVSASRSEVLSRALLWLPYLPLALAAVVGFGSIVRAQHGVLTALLGILVGAVLVRQFIALTENQDLLSAVAREAFRDSLTGLANRPHFLHRLEDAVAARNENGAPIAVLCLDLDNFKAVNDGLGHPAGDELLIRVAGRLTAALHENGLIARLGGDEFAVLLEGSVEEAEAAAHDVLEAFSAPIVIDGVPVAVRPSIGFTVATAASTCTVDQLLRHADLAMYTAKREGGQCVRSFVPDIPFSYTFPRSPESAVSAVSALPAKLAEWVPVSAAASGTSGSPRTARADPKASKPAVTPDPTDGLGWAPTPIRVAMAILAIGVITFTATSLAGLNTKDTFFTNFLYAALNLLAAGLIAVRAYRVATDRLAWLLIALGMTSSAIGDVVYLFRVPDGQSPSVADAEYLAFYPFVYLGLLLLVRARLAAVPIPIRLDPLVCGLAMAALGVALRAGPFHAAAIRAPDTVLVGLLYPWGDLVLAALAAAMLPMVGWRNEFRWLLLVAGLVGFALADTVYLFETAASTYRVGTTLDAAWPAASLLVAMASWASTPSTLPTLKRGFGSYTVPVVCTAVALSVIVLDENSRLATALAALSLITAAVRFSLTLRDVSMMAESYKHAMTDELTTLPNRRSLATALTSMSDSPSTELDAALKTPSRKALLLVKLYEIDEISDSLGRRFGDELLRHIADRLANTVRREDLLARVTDDEFAILLTEGSDLIGARAQAGRLLESLGEPFALDPLTVRVDARIAIALCPDHCEHPQELLSRAEAAMPHAKSAMGKIAVYDSAFEVYRDTDPNLIEELRTALFDGAEPTLYYQPKINTSDGSVHSVEALLRWNHPIRGVLLPEEFLPAAERAGLMRKIADRTLKLALTQIHYWREKGVTSSVAVNLATTNLLDLELVGSIERLLWARSLPADALIVEITESALVDSVRSRNTVAELQRLGVRISLDDYGTGWSSLARLQDVSVDELKLDRIFVARLAQDARSVAIVRSTVALADSLGADLVAEGVEDEVTLSALQRFGCMITQGFVHTPPLPPAELEEWIRHHVPQRNPRKSEQAGVAD
ncbi:cyclic diguanylate phosphodiesterase domain-containing protein [Mycobacterium lentiflavum]|uniref:Cyclic diguanylate phosphodiesterase domain-containing protein n=1 Tax=Mycobacterium lentiflavum TaxID=141349 RepID=A0A0E4H0D0_MYCLN|nr:bifunctional diguanylate cyclase/phosphodiesterase [Mycobacterium lentiflavum]CQD19234.1 cyclic diguanylate phosphodiesterase domain-containing protein [Mycobacterium lentiflavum]